MYFPYLRGRQFELIALRELIENNLIGEKIIPIIEPIKPTSTLAKTLTRYTEKGHLHALVVNPAVGEFVSKIKEKNREFDEAVQEIFNELKSEFLIRAYIMKRDTYFSLIKRSDLEELMIINPKRDCMDSYLKVYDTIEPSYTLIPDDRTFSRKTPKSKIMFEDRFTKAAKNADYSKNTDEFFSEDHLYYADEGFKGFSDYTIVGSEFKETGFAPSAVAIHIVYFDKNKVLRVHHFVSDSNNDINDPAGKFGEAVEKLVKWVGKSDVPRTTGLKAFLDCYEEGKYPGLGTVKKYSIMHHLELMNMFLEGEI